MADAPDVEASEITPEDFDADEKQDSPEVDSSPAEETKPEVAEDDKEEAKGDDTPADSEESTEEADKEGEESKEADADKPADEEKPLSEEKPLAPKSENRFQRLANERNQYRDENRDLRQQIEKMTAETYETQSVDQLTDEVNPDTGEPYTRAEARVVALEQSLAMKDFNEKVTNAHTVLGSESYEILQEMPMFNPESPEFDAELAEIAADTLEANLIRDPNMKEIDPATGKPTGRGVVVDFHRSPKQIYSKLAKIHATSETKGRQRGQKDTEEMLASADAPSSNAPPVKKKDPLAELWESPLT